MEHHISVTCGNFGNRTQWRNSEATWYGIVEWRRIKPDGYMPESGMESMFTVYDLERIYKIAHEDKLHELEKFEPIHKLKKRDFHFTKSNNFYLYWYIGVIICVGILAQAIYKL
jgi:hypothetical protein